jgi:hypothetical protein
MIVLNFSHPFSREQKTQIKDHVSSNESIEYHHIEVSLDNAQPFAKQIEALVDSIDLTTDDWQTLPILINPPAYNFAALTLLAELHGRMGYFPTIIRLKPVDESIPTRYEIAEVINLQQVRDKSRASR